MGEITGDRARLHARRLVGLPAGRHTDGGASDGEPLLLRAMLLDAAGSAEAARRELERITHHVVPCHLVTSEVEAWLLGGVSDRRRGNATRAHQGLLEALRLAEPLDLAIPFLAEEKRLELLHAGPCRFGRHESFDQQLSARHSSRSHGGEHGLDRLTAGKLAALRELPSRLTQKEIAAARATANSTSKADGKPSTESCRGYRAGATQVG